MSLGNKSGIKKRKYRSPAHGRTTEISIKRKGNSFERNTPQGKKQYAGNN